MSRGSDASTSPSRTAALSRPKFAFSKEARNGARQPQGGTYDEVGDTRERARGPRGLSLAYPEVRGPRRRVPVRAGRSGDDGCRTREGHAVRRERSGAGAPRKGVLLRRDREEAWIDLRSRAGAARENRERGRYRQLALESAGVRGAQGSRRRLPWSRVQG